MRQDEAIRDSGPQLTPRMRRAGMVRPRWWLAILGLMVYQAGAAAPPADPPLPMVDSHMHMRTATGDVEELFAKIQSLTQTGPVGAIVVACLPPWDDQALDQNALALLFKARHPRTTYAFGGQPARFLLGLPSISFRFR